MSEDDDYPVLTQVLRTGGGARLEAALPIRVEPAFEQLDVRPPSDAWSQPLEDGTAIDADATSLQAHGLQRPDNDPQAPGYDDGEQGGAPLVSLARPDVFDLPQDSDGRHAPASSAVVFDEPEIGLRPPTTEPAPSADDWKRLTDAVRASVLDDLGARIDTEFDARIAQVMHAEIETALARLQSALRDHLAEALRDVVGRAVEVEVMRRRTAATVEVPPA